MKPVTPRAYADEAGQAESSDAGKMLLSVPEALRPLLPELCAALREELITAAEVQGRCDGDEVREAAHRLKGAAMRFGLTELSLEAARAEEKAEKGNFDEAWKALAKFEGLLTQLESGIQTLAEPGWHGFRGTSP